ncbi:MAG: nuclear transport factor 2 family protein [Flavobacteriales bacterium]|nr:nuclear transport factor 2 family protein [Flavobacteriales bacterium]
MQTNLYFLALFLFFSCATEKVETKTSNFDKESASITIHAMMDKWHEAAAMADEETFFGMMSEKTIYLGTDKSERWTRDELREWSKKYFERDKAWAFSPDNRQLYFSVDGRTAWFEELLETWMGPCRGSGVLINRDSTWTLEHYNLAMLIDNEDVDAVLEVIQQQDEQPDFQQDSQ